jgi:5-methylcytosine-specific restriction endonuclease McrA
MRQKVLCLNASWEPLCAIPLQRAVVLVLKEKAVVVHEAEGEFRSVSASVPTPSVIRLVTYVKVPYRSRIKLTTPAVLARDGHVCAYCKKHNATTVDHVVPRSRGGAHVWENVVAACRRCNGKKADRLLADLGWTLDRTPYAPVGTQWLIIGLAVIDDTWRAYLGEAAIAVPA